MTDEFELADKTLLVTGSGRNIGKAIILEFAARGANVIVNTRSNVDEGMAVVEEAQKLGARALLVTGDAADRETIEKMKAQGEAAFGAVDMYVSNAARRFHKDFFDTTDEDWHQYLNQQLTASWYLAKAFAPGMRDRGWGRIIHMNGPDGRSGGWTRVPHSTAKGGLRTLTKSLASGLGRYGVTVNDIDPGVNDTIRDLETHPNHTPELVARGAATVPIQRRPRPDEVAWACAFLCAPRSGAITGMEFRVDGGGTNAVRH